MSNKEVRILDMRGKKKKTTWEKWEYDNWLPRSKQGVNRHCNQLGYSLSAMCRMKQRKVYPTEEHLRRAILSMLPKRFRSMKMELVEDNMVYGETNSYSARMQYPDGGYDSISVVKKPNGYSLKFGEDTIRSSTKEILGNEPIEELVQQLRAQRHERAKIMIERAGNFKAWIPNKDFDTGELLGVNDD